MTSGWHLPPARPPFLFCLSRLSRVYQGRWMFLFARNTSSAFSLSLGPDVPPMSFLGLGPEPGEGEAGQRKRISFPSIPFSFLFAFIRSCLLFVFDRAS
jgi:hypothetical protein